MLFRRIEYFKQIFCRKRTQKTQRQEFIFFLFAIFVILGGNLFLVAACRAVSLRLCIKLYLRLCREGGYRPLNTL